MAARILQGDCSEVLATLPDDSVHCVVCSPPYWGLRDYGIPPSIWGGDPNCNHVWGENQRTAWANAVPGPASRIGGSNPGKNGDGRRNETKFTGPFCERCGAWRGCLGLEPTPDLFVANMVEVYREVRRVLRPDGVCFLNLGDCYATGAGGGLAGLKPKDLVGIPWRVAFALQADGWYLRSDVIWSKPNPMPESVTDRPTKAHEYIFLLTKSGRYFWDQEAVREECAPPSGGRQRSALAKDTRYVGADFKDYHGGRTGRHQAYQPPTRNLRSVWTIPSHPFPDAHFATFPPALAETCIKAGTSERGCCPDCGAPWARVVKRTRTRNGSEVLKGAWASDTPQRIAVTGVGHWRDNTTTETTGWKSGCTCHPAPPVPCTVLDPFSGAGTTVLVADRLQRNGIGIELNTEYVEMAAARLSDDSPLFGGVA